MTQRTDFQGRSVDLRKVRGQARVTDHAVLRYMERVLGVPVDQIRQAMLTDTVLLAMAMKAPSVRAADHQVVFGAENPFTIVTVLTTSAHVRRPRRRKARWQAMQEQR